MVKMKGFSYLYSQTLIFEPQQYQQSYVNLFFDLFFVTGAFFDGCHSCLLNADPTKEG